MVPSALHGLFCLCTCLTLVHPFDWQDPNPVTYIKFSALMDAAIFGQTGIPRGKGPYSVGCTDLMFGYTDESTFLRLYYPTQNDDHSDTLWIPNEEYFFGLSKFIGKNWVIDKLLGLLFGSMTTPAKWDSPLRTGEKYPLIVFSHGLGAFRTIYSAIGIDLASHGFIVAAVEHRDGSAAATYYFKDQSAVEIGNKTWLYIKQEAPDRNFQVQKRAKECSQALTLILDIDHGKPAKNVLDLKFDVKQLKDSIDRNKIAIIGHSFGGATVIQALSEDQRFRCGIALDAWMRPLSDEVYARIPQPLFFINSEQFQHFGNNTEMVHFYSSDKERKMITIRGSVHQNFADFTFATGKIIGYMFILKGTIDSYVAIELSNKASLAFLQKHLGLRKGFDQWNSLIEGEDENLIPGTNTDKTTRILQNFTGIEK
ncbi:platelet-activating factor acetylhydrolase isoform X2 [Dasypus novemcinctus]|uniref:platelet-activating factor acetylhydrolase isoform X2 n=1 Tax=Dasypus novemcinctus TaxID=9361 RepID=UPI00265D9939|nr:platelet-activating factor acetylhydrolase isoform X2 [Dasypus novemcinctus]XP_058162817.1 platelet-activating factor acetylhydrolase isoform X2 [Dasypus novemcinctus]XP_058162818.1 platelet-activating factor acetylhydrolase isoform X2 [Dasypus novemcinctus]